jgi:hypothetical protein
MGFFFKFIFKNGSLSTSRSLYIKSLNKLGYSIELSMHSIIEIRDFLESYSKSPFEHTSNKLITKYGYIVAAGLLYVVGDTLSDPVILTVTSTACFALSNAYIQHRYNVLLFNVLSVGIASPTEEYINNFGEKKAKILNNKLNRPLIIADLKY